MNPLVVGGAIAGALLLFSGNKASARVIGATGVEDDLDGLADMLITETNFGKTKQEMAQIVWIAANRARRQGKPIWFVVQPGRGPKPVWNTGALYRKRFEEARDNPKWRAARDFAKSVLAGAYPNLGKTAFIHPQPMPLPPCVSTKYVPRTQAQTEWGPRCVPPWVLVNTQKIGSAWFA